MTFKVVIIVTLSYFRINVIVEPAAKQNNTLKEDEQVVYLGDDVPIAVKPNQRRKTNSESRGKMAKTDDIDGKCNIFNFNHKYLQHTKSKYT